MMRSTGFVVALTTLLCSACGDTELRLQLNRVSGDQPFDGLTVLEVELFHDGEIIAQSREAFVGTSVALKEAPRHRELEVSLVGFDSVDTVISRGRQVFDGPERGASCCVVVCLCTRLVFDNDQCNCGSGECKSKCRVP